MTAEAAHPALVVGPIWWVALLIGDFLFYVLLTPVWIGLRALAWIAEFRARRR